MDNFNEKDCLAYNPFEGDFGEPNDRILKDKIGIARKAGACFLCKQQIQPGEKIRMLTAIFSGELMHYRWCTACCCAMASIWNKESGLDLDPIDQRYALRYSKC